MPISIGTVHITRVYCAAYGYVLSSVIVPISKLPLYSVHIDVIKFL